MPQFHLLDMLFFRMTFVLIILSRPKDESRFNSRATLNRKSKFVAYIKRETLFFSDDTGYHISPTEVIKTRRVQREVEMAEPIRVSISSTKLLTKKLYVRKRKRKEKKSLLSFCRP